MFNCKYLNIPKITWCINEKQLWSMKIFFVFCQALYWDYYDINWNDFQIKKIITLFANTQTVEMFQNVKL